MLDDDAVAVAVGAVTNVINVVARRPQQSWKVWPETIGNKLIKL
jgi:hypothetical protein